MCKKFGKIKLFHTFAMGFYYFTKQNEKIDITSLLINTVAGAGGGYLGNMLK